MFRKGFDFKNNSYLPIFLLVAFNLVIGLIIVEDFGISLDEEYYIKYGRNSLSAYKNLGNNLDEIKLGPGNLIYYGPAYITFSHIVHNLIRNIDSSILSEEIFHFMYFLSFQIGLISIFAINRRFMNQWSAIGATLFFSTQPLLFGHAFINPKDIPFMAFFLATIASGLWLADSKYIGEEEEPFPKVEKFSLTLSRDWRNSKSYLFRILKRTGLIISIGVAIFLAWEEINLILAASVEYFLSADPGSSLGRLAALLAENSGEISLESYVQKATIIFWRIYSLIIGGIFFIFIFFFLRQFRITRRMLWTLMIQPFLQEFGLSLPRKIYGNLSNPRLILAGFILGICTSIRVIGPAAGGLIAIYLILQRRHNSVATIIAYFTVGALATYFLWPFLWEAPIARFVESLSLMTNFPWKGNVLFGGMLYKSIELPRTYLPTLLLVQFTEPTALLFLGGTSIAIYTAIARRNNIPGIVILLLWFWMPTLYTIIARPLVYDNFRQLLFIVPPIFVFSGIFLDGVYNILKTKWVFIVILAGIIAPGVYSSIKLHPYEYVYYNEYVGGLEGAFRNYELDYWATSYKETMEYVNQISDQNARIFVVGAEIIVRGYARPDLFIQSVGEIGVESLSEFNYGIATTRQNRDARMEFGGEEIYRVERDNALFVILKRFSD